jgi:hypothetical protein
LQLFLSQENTTHPSRLVYFEKDEMRQSICQNKSERPRGIHLLQVLRSCILFAFIILSLESTSVVRVTASRVAANHQHLQSGCSRSSSSLTSTTSLCTGENDRTTNNSIAEFSENVRVAANYLVEIAIKRNLNVTEYQGLGYGNGPYPEPYNPGLGDNYQERHAEEGDQIVTDGKFGKYIVNLILLCVDIPFRCKD